MESCKARFHMDLQLLQREVPHRFATFRVKQNLNSMYLVFRW